MPQVVDFKAAKQERERLLRKLHPDRLALVLDIARDHPEWGPKDLDKVHAELDSWGE
jgi:hypothetical protein